MHSSSSPPTLDPLDQQQQQHSQYTSPQRGPTSPLSNSHNSRTSTPQNNSQQNIPLISRDTTPVASSKPSTPSFTAQSSPFSPKSSVSYSNVTLEPTLSIGSTLSATAPQFQTKLMDAPIDLRGLAAPADVGVGSVRRATVNCGESGVFDPSRGVVSFNDGLTPTQETFPIEHKNPFATSNSSPSAFTEPSPLSPTSTVSSQSSNDTLRTPNVYINGLPPNYPEDQLFAMTREFGEVISVRTFTRHVSDKPSGYGFVLFGSVDAAGKCIETLRKYRNLHPSFSKQVHKIPGTPYATLNADSDVALPAATTETADSFKARMERLKDMSSTNLYMEGLPLSIDEPTLQALVNPYRIMSSRFFQTRLSNPPRIIAFVRLESRTAAEEVIERLHGRMIRGLCDAGSRISVRFADTSEQRELRRVERANHDGESSPARLTMAQAALLNMKGTQLHQQVQDPRIPSPSFGLSPPMVSNLTLAPDAYLQANLRPLPPPIGLHHSGNLPLATPDLSSMKSTHLPQYDGFNAQAADIAGPSLRVPPHMLGFDADSALTREIDVIQMKLAAMGLGQGMSGSAARAQEGYTALEQLILQAHAQQQQVPQSHRQDPSQLRNRALELNAAAAEFNPPSVGIGRIPVLPRTRQGGARVAEYLSPMSEEDFHSTARGHRQALADDLNPNSQQKSDRGVARLTLDDDSRLSFTRQRNQTHAEARAQAGAQAQPLHTRSTTVPSHYLGPDRNGSQNFLPPRPYNTNSSNRSSINTDNTNSNHTPNSLGNTAKNTSYHGIGTNSFTRAGNNLNMNSSNGLGNDILRDNSSNLTATPLSFSKPHAGDTDSQRQQHTHIDLVANTNRGSTLPRSGLSNDADDEDEGSGADSPGLSYSVRTPASLSPATPFSAFGETFDGPPMTAVKVSGPGGEIGLGMPVGVGVGMAGIQQKIEMSN